MRIPVFLSCLATCSIACVCFTFAQTPAEPTQGPESSVELNAPTAENSTSEPSTDPQGQAGGTGSAPRTKPTPTGTSPASTTYVYPTGRQMTRWWLRNTIGPKA